MCKMCTYLTYDMPRLWGQEWRRVGKHCTPQVSRTSCYICTLLWIYRNCFHASNRKPRTGVTGHVLCLHRCTVFCQFDTENYLITSSVNTDALGGFEGKHNWGLTDTVDEPALGHWYVCFILTFIQKSTICREIYNSLYSKTYFIKEAIQLFFSHRLAYNSMDCIQCNFKKNFDIKIGG